MVGIRDVAPDLLMPEGCITRAAPDADGRRRHRQRAGGAAARSSPFDIGQAVVVIDGHVVAVEDIEGTDGLLARVARLRARGPDPRQGAGRGVLVKAPKSGQDLRFDLPTIGPQNRRGRGRGRARRHRHRRRPHHCRRAAGHDRGRRRAGLFVRGCPRDAATRHRRRRAEDFPDRDGGIRRSARRQPDEGAAPAARRRGAFRGRRRPRDGARGPGVAVSDRATVDHGPCRRRQAAADDPAAIKRNRRRR